MQWYNGRREDLISTNTSTVIDFNPIKNLDTREYLARVENQDTTGYLGATKNLKRVSSSKKFVVTNWFEYKLLVVINLCMNIVVFPGQDNRRKMIYHVNVEWLELMLFNLNMTGIDVDVMHNVATQFCWSSKI